MPQQYIGIATPAVQGGVGCGTVSGMLLFGVFFYASVIKAVSADSAERILWALIATVCGAILLILTGVIVVEAVRSARRPLAPLPADEEAEG